MKITRLVIVVILVISGFVTTLMAQTQGRISGRVTDSSGAVIVGAKVTIENRGTQVKRVLDTNNSGDYVAPGIEPGMYSISVEAPNFRKVLRDRVQVEVANDLKMDFQLPPGAASEVLEVKDEAPLVDATTTTLNGVLANKAINELPLQGRDFQNLLALHPGVQREPGGGFHSVTSNGLRPDDNNYVIDGATDNDAYYGETVVNDAGIQGTPSSTLPLDAIQEFNTQEQQQADFRRKAGSGGEHRHQIGHRSNSRNLILLHAQCGGRCAELLQSQPPTGIRSAAAPVWRHHRRADPEGKMVLFRRTTKECVRRWEIPMMSLPRLRDRS